MSRQRLRSVRFVMVTVLVVLAASWAPARAQSEMGAHDRGAGRSDAARMLPLLLQSANLTPEQDAKVRQILSARRAASQALVEQLRQAQDELADKLFAPGSLKEADLQPQLQKITQLREQLLKESTKVGLEVRAVLTPEQLGKAAQVKDRMRQLHNEMRQLLHPGNP